MISGLSKFFDIQQLLVQLLTMTQTRKFYLDIRTPGKADHSLGQVHNTHRLTHIENIDLSPISHASGFKHQTTGFGDSHKIAYNFRMRHSHRASTLYLIAETRNHRTIRTQHITKTRSDELSDMSALCQQFLCQ